VFTYWAEIHQEENGFGCDVGAQEGPQDRTGWRTPLSIGRKFTLFVEGSMPGHKNRAAPACVETGGKGGTSMLVCSPVI
jgi:hypothetical protein